MSGEVVSFPEPLFYMTCPECNRLYYHLFSDGSIRCGFCETEFSNIYWSENSEKGE